MSKLDKIQLKGFKSIRELNLELKSMNILIGPNGVGKSNFMNFFRFMNKLMQNDLQFFLAQQGEADNFLHFGRQITDVIEIHILFQQNSYICTLVPNQSGGLIFKEEYCESVIKPINSSKPITNKQVLANIGDKESGLLEKSSTHIATKMLASYFSDWQVYHFHETSDTAKIKQSGAIDDNERLRPQAENLAAFLFSIQDTGAYQKIIQTIQRVAPFFQDFILKPAKNNPNQIKLRWKHHGNDAYFDANALSDGTLRFICLTTLLLQPVLPTIILLDEPELGLHPYAIQLLASMMRSIVHKTQIIASTQSVTFANQFEWQNLIMVEQHDNASQLRWLEEDKVKIWLDNYRIGEIWEKNLLGGTPLC